MRKNSWKFVYILPKQCRSHFNLTNFFDWKKFQNSNFAQIFTKTSHPNLVSTPCILPAKLECVRCPMFRCSISISKFEFCLLPGSNSTFHVILAVGTKLARWWKIKPQSIKQSELFIFSKKILYLLMKSKYTKCHHK
mgnify:CR=1 FL=1